MKTKLLFIFSLILVFSGANRQAFPQSKISPKALTILYSNNINGEIDPCPT